MSKRINDMENKKREVGFLERAGYCLIEIGNQFCWTMVSTYLSVFYTDVVGLAPAVVSIILLIARIWDGVNDPMMGAIAEKTNTRFGKYRPYLIFGAPAVAIFSILTFSKINVSMSAMIGYAAVTYIFCGMAYTAVCISQGSLANVMTRNLQTRVELNSLRQMGSGITGLVISAASMPLILYFGHGSTSSASGYFYTNIIFAILGAATVMFGGITCKERVIKDTKVKTPGLGESFAYVLKNKNVLLMTLIGVFTAGSILGRMGVLSYYFIYYVGKPAMMAPALMAYNICTIIAQLYVPFLTNKLGKKKACLLSYIMQTVSLLIVFAGGQNGHVLIYAGSAIMGFSNFAPSILNSIMGDIVDREEVQTGKRSDGIVYSMLSLGTKIGIAVGGAISVALLGAIGYVANAEQSASTIKGIGILTNIAPIVFVFFAAVCLVLIDITDKEANENRAILEERMKN